MYSDVLIFLVSHITDTLCYIKTKTLYHAVTGQYWHRPSWSFSYDLTYWSVLFPALESYGIHITVLRNQDIKKNW